MGAKQTTLSRLWHDGGPERIRASNAVDSYTVFTQREVAELLGMTWQHVQQIERRALWRLRHNALARQLFTEHFGREPRV